MTKLQEIREILVKTLHSPSNFMGINDEMVKEGIFLVDDLINEKEIATSEGYKALNVIAKTPKIRKFLTKNDPKALQQVENAIFKMS